MESRKQPAFLTKRHNTLAEVANFCYICNWHDSRILMSKTNSLTGMNP